MTYCSPNGEEGYPGQVILTVTYSVTENNELRIEYNGTTDRPTILNPTHHSYFNLTGSFEQTILDHLLTIESDCITEVEEGMIPTGKFIDVSNTPMDFCTPYAVGLRIQENYNQLKLGNGYDHNWVLRNYNRSIREVARLYEPKSRRLMTVSTDQPGLQFYSGNYLHGLVSGKKDIRYQRRTGLCLETQFFPDSPNKPKFPSVVLKSKDTYRQTTIYKFSIG